MAAEAEASAAEARMREACIGEYDGDACRPEAGFDPEYVAQAILSAHWDIARCYCPACVVARAYLKGDGS